jgi:two-component system, OmpR family, sensor histidine kinase KdpD
MGVKAPWPSDASGPSDVAEPLETPLFEAILDALGAASMGDLDRRVPVDPTALEDPLELVANAVNLLLDDLRHRQSEREEALRQVSAGEAKEEFLASLSHDMQTPLAIILGALHVLDSSDAAEHLDATLPLMRAAAHRLQRFIQQFLDLARLEAHELLVVRPVRNEVRPLVDRAVELFVEHAPVRVEVPDDLPPVLADPERVEQILANLLSNALNYAKEPSITARAVDGAVEIVVADRGRGMDAEQLERAFAKFERIDATRAPSGTGLGLFISRAMANAQGGSLVGESEPGVGSRFILRLPRAPVADGAGIT